jgi:hypothetical protein
MLLDITSMHTLCDDTDTPPACLAPCCTFKVRSKEAATAPMGEVLAHVRRAESLHMRS